MSYRRSSLIIVPTARLAGAELNLKRISLEMKRRKSNVKIIFLSNGHNEKWKEFEDAECVYINSRRLMVGFLKSISILVKWRLNGYFFDYSFTSHTMCNAFIGLMISIGILKVDKVIYRESTNPFSYFTGKKLIQFRLMYKCYEKTALIICQTEKMKNELLANIKSIEIEKVKVVANPVDFFVVREMSIEKKLLVGVGKNEIVCVGRLVPEKGFDILLRAFAELKVVQNNYTLRIIGAGPETKNLAIIAKELKIEKYVIFSGHIENPIPFMRNACLCVLSSVCEGYPNVLLEMMCVAKRVVATECTDGIDGLPGIHTCLPEQVAALAAKISDALSDDKMEVRSNIRKMRKHTKGLTIEDFVSGILDN